MAFAEGKFFYIRSRCSGHVLDVQGSGEDPGTLVITYPKGDDLQDNQLWYEDFVTGTIRTKMNDFCLDVVDGTLCVNPYNPEEENQKWMTAGERVQNGRSPLRVLDVKGSCCDEGTEVCAWDYHGGKNQRWYLEHIPVQYFYIRSQMHGKVLDVRGSDDGPGADVIMYDQNDDQTDNQLWYEDREGMIHNKMNGFVLDVVDKTLKLNPFDPASDDQGFSYSDHRVANRNRDVVLDIRARNDENGAEVVSWEFHGGENQLWDLEYI